jgi:hypothetical protein
MCTQLDSSSRTTLAAEMTKGRTTGLSFGPTTSLGWEKCRHASAADGAPVSPWSSWSQLPRVVGALNDRAQMLYGQAAGESARYTYRCRRIRCDRVRRHTQSSRKQVQNELSSAGRRHTVSLLRYGWIWLVHRSGGSFADLLCDVVPMGELTMET